MQSNLSKKRKRDTTDENATPEAPAAAAAAPATSAAGAASGTALDVKASTATTTAAANSNPPNYQGVTLEVDMNGTLKPAITFAAVQSAPPPDAIYIEAVHEIITEVESTAEQVALLTNLNALLETKVPAFIDISIKTKKFIKQLNALGCLPNNNNIVKLLEAQASAQTELDDFKETCKAVGAQTIYLGGVYGRYCVTTAARTFAPTILTKQLGGEGHLNVRFQDPHESHRFVTAVIYPPITEGYTDYPQTFPWYMAFPETRSFSVPFVDFPGVLEQAEDKLERESPEDLGISFRDNFEEFDCAANHKKLFNMMGYMAESDRITHSSLTEHQLLLESLIKLIRSYLFKHNWNDAPHFFGAAASAADPQKRLKSEQGTAAAASTATAAPALKSPNKP